MGHLKEECGVFGIFCHSTQDVATAAYYGLFALQHRGQESCGIVVNDDGLFKSYKDLGLVNDVFTPDVMKGLGLGNMAVGHVRYSTTGGSDRSNAQPIVVNHIKGSIALAHNGNLVNSAELREQLELSGSIFHTTSDTEVICYEIIKERLSAPSIEEAVNRAMNRIHGAYSLCIMSPSKLIAARDINGLRPLCYGVMEDGSYVIASESCALDAVGATLIREIRPGEILVIDKNGVRSIADHCGKAEPHLCVMEYIYFARPDSVIDGHSVHKARVNAGRILAREHPVEADIVVGLPDSGLDAAIGFSRESGIPYGMGFIKNKYIGRTFIAPGQKAREDKVRIKLNPISEVVRGKRVVVVDDSIVRGTTTARTIRLIRDAGAREVHVRISSPPYVDPCYYGIDVDSKENLIACKHTVEEIAKIIGADSLGYLSLENVTELTGCNNGKGFCTACFCGKYPTDIPVQTGKNRFEKKIIESDKSEKSIFYKKDKSESEDSTDEKSE
ncbi:MAG: amidophosphoribosyltransferase [Eubacteriales bacterium]